MNSEHKIIDFSLIAKKMPKIFRSKINLNKENVRPIRTKSSGRIVQIRLIFIRIGEIDTLNEKYQAEIYFEARWTEKISLNNFNLNLQQEKEFVQERRTIKLENFNPNANWTPMLFIENAIGQIGELERWFTGKRILNESTTSPLFEVEICEHRRFKGVFWEKLELNHVKTQRTVHN